MSLQFPIKLKYLSVFFFLFCLNLSYGQLSSFTLQLSATNETCNGNGSLTFTVANTTPSATIIFNVYRLPDVVTPIATTNASSLTGLIAGNYRVVATQSLGTENNSQQQDITIVSQIVQLGFDLVGENEVCGDDGKITVNAIQGNAVSYEIFSGPMIRPLQASNIFTGLTAGTYQVRVFDNCGEGVVRTYVVSSIPPGLIISDPGNIDFVDCNTTIEHLYFSHSTATDIAYPLTVECTLFPPGGGTPLLFNQTINGPNSINNNYFYSQQMPLYAYQYYTYNAKVTDRCGNIYLQNNIVVDSDITPIFTKEDECGIFDVGYIWALGASIISAPSAFTGTLPYPFTVLGVTVNAAGLPAGAYTFSVTDICGNVRIENRILTPSELPAFGYLEGCEIGMSQVLSFGTALQMITITSAPSTYQNAIPDDVTGYLDSSGHFLMTLPGGSYTFEVLDVCGNTSTHNITTQGYSEITNFELIRHCDSFDFDFSHSSNYTGGNVYFWLQKRDPSSGQWGHPVTGTTYIPNTIPNTSNSMLIRNNDITTNIVGSGSYRIMKSDDRRGEFLCVRVIKKFGYSTDPAINDFYSFVCPNGTYEILVDAEGLDPLIYRITTKDGQPFVVNNGNSSLFSGLLTGIYNFQVEDSCGNITNRLFEINDEIIFPITPSELCAAQPGFLSVPNFPFLHYEWWKDNNTTNILSSTSTLQLNPFSLPADLGTYHVRITNPGNPNSCINAVVDYTISPDMANPNAGGDNNVAYCGSQGVVNLFNVLSGTYQANGTWQETTESGILDNNLWDSSLVNPGVYHFTYTVNGLCGSSDESQVTIEIKSIPQVPVASVDPVVCDAHAFQLFASDIPNATYQWMGPNGFSSTMQNPIIDNASAVNEGVYTVSVFENGCESNAASVEVVVDRSPAFDIINECKGNVSLLSAVPLNDSFNADTATFSWTYPDGTIVNGNPAIITGQETGSYVLTVTSVNGCSTSKSMDVLCTKCGIPRGVSPNGDGLNDTFDLSCLQGIVNVKIFNRYGVNVYELDNYVDQWDGKDYKGRLLPAATYYYVVKFDTGDVKTGWVYLNY